MRIYNLMARSESWLSSSSRVGRTSWIHTAIAAMASLKFPCVFMLVLAAVFAFPQPNSDDSAVAVSPEASPIEGESVDSRYRPVHRPYGYGGQQYGSNYYSSQQYESHYASQQYGHSYGHQNYGHNPHGHQSYHGNDYYNRPDGYGYNGYNGYHGEYYDGYYGRPQGILGTVGSVLDGLLGLREGEKKQTTDSVIAPAVGEPPAAILTDSAPSVQSVSSPDGDGIIFQ